MHHLALGEPWETVFSRLKLIVWACAMSRGMAPIRPGNGRRNRADLCWALTWIWQDRSAANSGTHARLRPLDGYGRAVIGDAVEPSQTNWLSQIRLARNKRERRSASIPTAWRTTRGSFRVAQLLPGKVRPEPLRFRRRRSWVSTCRHTLSSHCRQFT
jgi:hypothetical protein